MPILPTNCVFYNTHNNTNTNTNTRKEIIKYISEIVSYSPSLNNEIINVNTIKHRIPDYKFYFFVYIDYHQLQKSEVKLKNEYDNDIDSNSDIRLFHKSASEYLFKFENRQCIYFKDYLKSLSSSRKYIFQFIHFYKHLLEGLRKLVSINMVHGNIHMDNIIVINDNAHFTDFRSSIEVYENMNMNMNMNNNEQSNLIEFHLLSYMKTRQIKSLSQYNIHLLVDKLYEEQLGHLIKPFGDTLYNQMVDEAKEYYFKYVNKPVEVIWTDMCNWFFTWDNYLLSIVYLKIMIGLHSHVKNNIDKNKFLIGFMKLLVANIHPNPTKRKTISETLEIFDNIIYSCEPNVYKDLIKYI
uniref:Protein kinase domain-containing protein n=1 Tax=viral metagenome TaxID=1070528 RepID=A0A6C0IS01_9ZZZZ